MLTGTRVRFTPDYYITRELLPPRNWAGSIKEERRSLTGQPTKFVIALDKEHHEEAMDTEVDALEDELIPE